MKSLKKALSLLVVVAMVLGSMTFVSASFADVAADHVNAQAIETAAALGLVQGDENGNFNPDATITRAEAAAMIVRARGAEAQAESAKGATQFTDVPADHWASGYINIATSLGIINGMGDGTFEPESTLKYEQVVKMIVEAIGYGNAIDRDNYPISYLTKAGELGITTTGIIGMGIGVDATRAVVAQLLCNTLDVPLMKATGYGAWQTYEIYDGYNTVNCDTMASEYLGLTKVQATVVSSLDLADTNDKNDDQVVLDVVKTYNNKYSSDVVALSNFKKGDTNVRDLIGYKVVAYVDYDPNSSEAPTIAYVRKDVVGENELVVKTADVTSVTIDGNAVTVKYWPSDDAKKTESVDLALDEVNVYINGQLVEGVAAGGTATITALTAIGRGDYNGEIVFAQSNNRIAGDYDSLFVTDFTNYVVKSVNTNSKQIAMYVGQPMKFTENSDQIVTIVDVDGNEVDWTELKPYDVLSAKVVRGGKTVIYATLVRNEVQGAVDEADTTKGIYVIGDEEYKLSSARDIEVGDEGSFYLDINGKIAYANKTVSLSKNFAYVIATGTTGTINKVGEIKVLNYDGEVVTYKTADKVTVDAYDYDPEDGEFAKETITNVSAATLLTGTDPIVATGDVITIEVNSDGVITRVAIAASATGERASRAFNLYATGEATYKDSNKLLTVAGKKVNLDDETIILVADKDTFTEDLDYTKIAASDLESTEGEETLTVSVYNVNDSRVAGLVVLADKQSTSSTGIAMVKNIRSAKDEDGTSVNRLTLLNGGEEISILTAGSAKVGDTITYDIDSKGKAVNIKVLVAAADIAATGAAATSTDKDINYYFGQVLETADDVYTYVIDNVIGVAADRGETKVGSANGDVVVYYYDNRGQATSVSLVEDADIITARLATMDDLEGGMLPEGTTEDTYEGIVIYDEEMQDGTQAIKTAYAFAAENEETNTWEIVVYVIAK